MNNRRNFFEDVVKALQELGISQTVAATEIARIYYKTESPTQDEIKKAKFYVEGIIYRSLGGTPRSKFFIACCDAFGFYPLEYLDEKYWDKL